MVLATNCVEYLRGSSCGTIAKRGGLVSVSKRELIAPRFCIPLILCSALTWAFANFCVSKATKAAYLLAFKAITGENLKTSSRSHLKFVALILRVAF